MSCNDVGSTFYTSQLSFLSKSNGYCLEIGNGAYDSVNMPLENQVQIACEKVKGMKQLQKGYNFVGLSMGNLVGRGLLEFCDGAPPVKNFLSICEPNTGVAFAPPCIFENEHIVTPKESSWFGFYQDGTYSKILPPQETNLYVEDLFGLQTVDKAAKVKFIKVPGLHLVMTIQELQQYVVPYLIDGVASAPAPAPISKAV